MRRSLVKLFTAVSFIALTIPGVSMAMPYSNMFVLGDSLSDIGNLFKFTADRPASFPSPLPQDPPYYQGRFADGPIYAEYLWQSLGLPGDLTASSSGGTNYAVGGARSRYHRFDLSTPGGFNPTSDSTAFPTLSLLGQRDALLSDAGGSVDSNALFTVWEGANDVADALAFLGASDPATANAIIFQAANDIVSVVTDLVGAGAWNLLIPNVPNLGLVPAVVGDPVASGAATALSQALNGLVEVGLASLNANIIRLDTFTFLNELVADPASFGFPAGTNSTDPCFTGFVGAPGTVCSNPESYVFWDMLHPSAATHREIGRVAANAVPEPTILVLMGLGLAVISYQRRRSKKAA